MANLVQSQNSLEPQYKRYRNLSIIGWIICFGSWLLWVPSFGNPLVAIVFFGGGIFGNIFHKRAKILKSGLQGEKAIQGVFSTLPDSYTVLSDLSIIVEGKQSQIDTVIVGPTGVYVCEVKNLNGEIIGTAADQQITQHKTGRRGGEYSKQLYNPVKQVGTHVYRLKTLLRSKGINTWVQGLVYFSNPKAEVHLTSEKIPVFCRRDDGEQQLIQLINEGEEKLTPEMQEKIVSLLKIYLKVKHPFASATESFQSHKEHMQQDMIDRNHIHFNPAQDHLEQIQRDTADPYKTPGIDLVVDESHHGIDHGMGTANPSHRDPNMF